MKNVTRKLILINKEGKCKNGLFVLENVNKNNNTNEDDGQSIGEETSLSF